MSYSFTARASSWSFLYCNLFASLDATQLASKTETKRRSALDKRLVVNRLQATLKYNRLICIARLFGSCGSGFTLKDVSITTAVAPLSRAQTPN